MTDRELTFGQALREATVQEMKRDPSIFIMGLGVDDPRGMYGTTGKLDQEFGKDRNFDTPLSEDAMTGFAIGAAMAGMRPIHVHQRFDFLLLCMNQLMNIAAKYPYMFAGKVSIPLVVRGIIGRSWGQGAQHSQALHSFFMHVPGMKVAAPTTPHDAKGCMIAAIRDNNPVIFMEHRMLYGNKGVVAEAPYEVNAGESRVLTHGNDITIVAISHMVVEALRAGHHLKERGINAEVIDPVWLAPLDIDTIFASVRKTGNLLVVDNGWLNCGASAEISLQVHERLQEVGKTAKIARMGFAATSCPTTKPLENLFYPNARTIAAKAVDLLAGSPQGWLPHGEEAREITEFKGPF